MLVLLIVIVLIVGGIVQLIKKYIMGIKDPTIEELWNRLDQEEWFIELCKDPKISSTIHRFKEKGILKDAHYVERLLTHQGTVEGFKDYVKERS
jgi:SOS response regulatory protein OraA/RecX